jgi:hypothetical protein
MRRVDDGISSVSIKNEKLYESNQNKFMTLCRHRVSWLFVCFKRTTGNLSSSSSHCRLDITHNKYCNTIIRKFINVVSTISISSIFVAITKTCTTHTKKINLLLLFFYYYFYDYYLRPFCTSKLFIILCLLILLLFVQQFLPNRPFKKMVPTLLVFEECM